MADKREVEITGCLPWMIYLVGLIIAMGLYSVAEAIRSLHHG